ncbi:MAG TPA: tRNA lysidine(34) synthetase TilS [Chitinophagaceae bacterium]|nr:tRNA lysidine(34) synthetase TilS [Chitinophagaceae bacterium]
MELLRQFKAYIQKHDLFQPKDKLLLAVSGGVDSVVLCELCKQAGYQFTIAHCNFQLRGDESMRDENFVNALGPRYGAEVLVQRFDTEAYARQHKYSIQVAARELRYAWFNSIVQKHPPPNPKHLQNSPLGPTHIVTAHHAGDNIETVLMNFFKGTGMAGLRGILPKQGNIVRPLLFATKDAIKQFAADNQLQWVEDSSNAQDTYTRNYVRHNVLPVIKEIYSQAESNLATSIERFREIETLYRDKVNDVLKKLVERKGGELHIPILKLKKTSAPGAILYELMQPLGFTSKQVEEALHLMQSETGKYVVSETHRILKNRNWLIISSKQSADALHILIEGPGKISFPPGILSLQECPVAALPAGHGLKLQATGQRLQRELPASLDELPRGNDDTALLDASAIQFPLLLRKWKPGDYFYPLGMRKKKKLARFFIDQKLSAADKENIWVLEIDKKILWIVGLRIDDRFKITDKTTKILQIKYSTNEK